MSDGIIEGDNIVCGLHNWNYRYNTGISSYNNSEKLHKFSEVIEGRYLCVAREEILTFEKSNPQLFQRGAYQGIYADTHSEDTEPYSCYIWRTGKKRFEKLGHHGFKEAMGVARVIGKS